MLRFHYVLNLGYTYEVHGVGHHESNIVRIKQFEQSYFQFFRRNDSVKQFLVMQQGK